VHCAIASVVYNADRGGNARAFSTPAARADDCTNLLIAEHRQFHAHPSLDVTPATNPSIPAFSNILMSVLCIVCTLFGAFLSILHLRGKTVISCGCSRAEEDCDTTRGAFQNISM